jgi:hypothetical protein
MNQPATTRPATPPQPEPDPYRAPAAVATPAAAPAPRPFPCRVENASTLLHAYGTHLVLELSEDPREKLASKIIAMPEVKEKKAGSFFRIVSVGPDHKGPARPGDYAVLGNYGWLDKHYGYEQYAVVREHEVVAILRKEDLDEENRLRDARVTKRQERTGTA